MSLATFTTWIYLVKLSSFQFTVSFVFTSSPRSCFSKFCDSSVDILQNGHRQFLLRKISWALESSVVEQDTRMVDDVFSKYTEQYISAACISSVCWDHALLQWLSTGAIWPPGDISNVLRHIKLSVTIGEGQEIDCYWHLVDRNAE